MSYEFEVRTRFGKLGEFEEVLTGWWRTIAVPSDLHLANDDYGWIFAPGESIRGCSIRRQRRRLGSGYDVRLSIAASRTDWRIAYAFLRLAFERGATVLAEDGAKMRLSDLSDTAADEMARTTFPAGIHLLQRMLYEKAQDPITLPNFRFSLIITRDDLPQGQLTNEHLKFLETTLGSRTAKYRGVRLGANILLRDGTIAVAWGGEALISNVGDFLIFPRTLGNADIDDHVYQPWAVALERLGTAAELINGQVPSYFLRAFHPEVDDDGDQWKSLCEGARGIGELSSN